MVATPNPPIRQRPELVITWEKPPADFILDDTPVENTGQPLIAGALRESLELTGRIQPENLIASNFDTWRGKKEERDGYWLRWWDEAGQLLPWAVELVKQERQKAE